MNLVTPPPITFPACLARERAEGHPERPDHRRAVERAFEYELFQMLARETAPREHEMAIGRAHPLEYVEALRAAAPTQGSAVVDQDTSMSPAASTTLRGLPATTTQPPRPRAARSPEGACRLCSMLQIVSRPMCGCDVRTFSVAENRPVPIDRGRGVRRSEPPRR